MGTMFPFQLQKILLHGNGNVIALDATFGTNHLGVSLVCPSETNTSAFQGEAQDVPKSRATMLLLMKGEGKEICLKSSLTVQYHLYTLMVFDTHHNGIPAAWIISASAMEVEVQYWLSALKTHMQKHNPGWQTSCFLVDDYKAEISAIE